MTTEVACLKCGDSNIQKKTWTIYRRNGKRVWATRPVLLGIGGLSLLILIMSIIAVLTDPENEWFMILLGFLYFGAFPGYLLIDFMVSDKIKQNQYTCLKCGHKWAERIDEEGHTIRCVNCNNTNTLTRKSVHDPTTGKKINGFLFLGLGGLLTILGAGMLILTIFNWGFMTFQGLATGLIALSGGIPMMRKYLTGKKLLKHRCLDCGHTWEEVQGDTPKSP